MNDEALDDKLILGSKILRLPMVAAIGLSFIIYLILVMVYYLDGQPTKFSSLLNWLGWSILFVPTACAGIIGQLRIGKNAVNTPRLTFLILFFWMMSILPFSVLISTLMILELFYLISLVSSLAIGFLKIPTIFLVASIGTLIVWSRTAPSIVMRPLMAIDLDGKNIRTTIDQKRNLGCLLSAMIGGILVTFMLSVSGSVMIILTPFTIVTEFLLALLAMSMYKMEDRKIYLLLIIWLIPTCLVVTGIALVTEMLTSPNFNNF